MRRFNGSLSGGASLALCLATFITTANAAEPAAVTTTAPVVLEANPTTRQLEAAIYLYWESVQSLDPVRYANNFAPDGTLEDPAGGTPVMGRQAIAATYGGGLTVLGRITPRVKDMYVGIGSSTEVTVRWQLIAFTKAGKLVTVDGIGLFKFKPFHAGDVLQLESVREFYDPIQFSSQLQ